jgi:hypothetical protein
VTKTIEELREDLAYFKQSETNLVESRDYHLDAWGRDTVALIQVWAEIDTIERELVAAGGEPS